MFISYLAIRKMVSRGSSGQDNVTKMRLLSSKYKKHFDLP